MQLMSPISRSQVTGAVSTPLPEPELSDGESAEATALLSRMPREALLSALMMKNAVEQRRGTIVAGGGDVVS